MKAIKITKPGDSEVLALVEREIPKVQADEILVRVAATAVNRADILQRKGLYPPPPFSSADVPGLEYAGIVEAIGNKVSLFKPGDRVFGLMSGGTYQDYLTTHERLAMPVPEHLDLLEAASIPEAFITAYDALILQAKFRHHETALVSAAASSVGVAAGQLIKCFHGTAIGSTRTSSKVAALEPYFHKILHVESGTALKFAGDIKDFVCGIDVVLELAGAAYLNEDFEAANHQARIILIGLLAGAKDNINFALLLRKRLTLIGTTLRARPLEEKIAVTQAFAREVLPFFQDKKLMPVIDRVFPMSQVALAHDYLESNANIGKVVLDNA
jgi:putative PIG3 family NAD(P)H quinone oxidoreductase